MDVGVILCKSSSYLSSPIVSMSWNESNASVMLTWPLFHFDEAPLSCLLKAQREDNSTTEDGLPLNHQIKLEEIVLPVIFSCFVFLICAEPLIGVYWATDM